mmetsp:Transcript_55136/g.117164  ORF Transcript_55136/g.117164 Transcript_55136/m.117164 type:complete len:127 (-) Transcript_55136:101-481(-)
MRRGQQGDADKGTPTRREQRGDASKPTLTIPNDANRARGGHSWGIPDDVKREQEVGVAMARMWSRRQGEAHEAKLNRHEDEEIDYIWVANLAPQVAALLPRPDVEQGADGNEDVRVKTTASSLTGS